MAAQKKTFEALYAQLEDTTRQLEHGNLPLEDSIKLYERGAGLVEELRRILDEAELHVKTLQVRLQPPEAAMPRQYPSQIDSDFGEDEESAEDHTLIELNDDGELVEADAEIDIYEYEDNPTDD